MPLRQRGQIARLSRTGGTGVAPESHRRFGAVRPRGNPSPLPEEGGRWGAGAFGGTGTAAVAAGEQNDPSAWFAGDARQVETALRADGAWRTRRETRQREGSCRRQRCDGESETLRDPGSAGRAVPPWRRSHAVRAASGCLRISGRSNAMPGIAMRTEMKGPPRAGTSGSRSGTVRRLGRGRRLFACPHFAGSAGGLGSRWRRGIMKICMSGGTGAKRRPARTVGRSRRFSRWRSITIFIRRRGESHSLFRVARGRHIAGSSEN